MYSVQLCSPSATVLGSRLRLELEVRAKRDFWFCRTGRTLVSLLAPRAAPVVQVDAVSKSVKVPRRSDDCSRAPGFVDASSLCWRYSSRTHACGRRPSRNYAKASSSEAGCGDHSRKAEPNIASILRLHGAEGKPRGTLSQEEYATMAVVEHHASRILLVTV